MDGAGSLPRLLAGWLADRPLTLAEHRELHGPLSVSRRAAPELIDAVEASGLRGRGGSGFPTAIKLRAVASAPRRRRRVVIGNGAEGEPDSVKDTALLRHSPHLVLDGLAVAAAAVEADEAILCVGSDAPEALEAVERAIAERAGLDAVTAQVAEVPQDYVAGEETALVNYLNTGRPLPTFTPPRPYERGLGGRPTLVQNTETLAHLALVATRGADWFRGLGTADDPGTALVTVSGAVRSPGVYEIEGGTPLRVLLETAGGANGPVQAYLVGGYAGTWVEPDLALDLRLGHAAMRELGRTLGPGAVYALSAGDCGLRETARIARHLADHSSGQCGPCAFGLPAMAGALEEIAEGVARPGAFRWVEYWGGQVDGRGACHHPDGAVRMITSALAVFAGDVTRHETGDGCVAAAAILQEAGTR